MRVKERGTDSEKRRVNWLLHVTWKQSLIGQSADPRLSLPFSLTPQEHLYLTDRHTPAHTHSCTHIFKHNTCHHYHLFIFSLHLWHILLRKISDSRELIKREKEKGMERQWKGKRENTFFFFFFQDLVGVSHQLHSSAAPTSKITFACNIVK